eukprot:gene11934-12077_t
MASFLAGVKNLFFGKKTEEGSGQQEQHQTSSAHNCWVGHKRDRSQVQQENHQRPAPVLQDAGQAGGIQGLGWYTASLQLDPDGDAAHGFYQEHSSSSQLQHVKGMPQSQQHPCRLLGVEQGKVLDGAHS